MNREEKNALARRHILDAAMGEFSARGYEGASLNTAYAENGISKGIIYHHFKDKNEIYLLCVRECFDNLTTYLKQVAGSFSGTMEEGLEQYFSARLHFFAEHPLYLGLFADAAFRPPQALAAEIAECRREFDGWNITILTGLLEGSRLRPELSARSIAEEFRMYMDFFNSRFQDATSQGGSPEYILKEHEERCRRQINILLHGVLGD